MLWCDLTLLLLIRPLLRPTLLLTVGRQPSVFVCCPELSGMLYVKPRAQPLIQTPCMFNILYQYMSF